MYADVPTYIDILLLYRNQGIYMYNKMCYGLYTQLKKEKGKKEEARKSPSTSKTEK